MIILESKLIGEEYVEGYYLTLNDLRKLLKDFESGSNRSFKGITNKKAFIDQWLKTHERIVKKD